jgi:acyl-CoA synthetase (AMP-forming)/AMP-acid ligase II
MPEPKLILDHVYDHEAARPGHVFLTQPVGGGAVLDYTWQQVLDQARRMAAHLQRQHRIEPGARIAMLTKNCAHFFIAELAIWIAGGTTVAIFPTETADTVRYVLEHGEARLLIVGKLDNWPQQAAAAAGLPCIALPLAPAITAPVACERWDDIVARTAPLSGRPQRAADDLGCCATRRASGRLKGNAQLRRSRGPSNAACRPRAAAGRGRRGGPFVPAAGPHLRMGAVIACRSLRLAMRRSSANRWRPR